MIPGNGFTATPVASDFIDPYDRPYSPAIAYSRGGVALNDGSQGREVGLWFVTASDTTIDVHSEAGGLQLSLPIPGASNVSLAFDQNMQPAIAYSQSGVHRLRYFDTLLADFNTLVEPTATSARCVIDDAREAFGAASDIVWAYIRDGVLYYRIQRDRYLIEYTVGPAEGTITGMGPNQGLRLQFKITP